MNIVLYNWAPINSNTGGGVTVYLKNILEYFSDKPNYHVYYISSGYNYEKPINHIFYREIENNYGDNIKAYEIVNSPMYAPSKIDNDNIKAYLYNDKITECFESIINEIGDIDVIHFNNLEGLSINCLKIKEKYPNTRIVYSAHNYFLVCPQIMLWKYIKNGGENCIARDCGSCAFNAHLEWHCIHLKRRVSNSPVIKLFSFLTKYNPKIKHRNLFEAFLRNNIDAVRKDVDVILAVSQRVKSILIERGIPEEKIITSYIGTKVADEQMDHSSYEFHINSPLRIIYLGYMRQDKGFYFLLDALEQMPNYLACRISLTIAAKYSAKNKKDLDRIDNLKSKLHDVELLNGYSANDEKSLLADKHLGVVPVIWEDNLPQVLIEQIAYGVPVLVSNMGGGAELVNNQNFIFSAGDVKDFNNKIAEIIDNPKLLSEFWQRKKHLTTINEHIDELIKIYKGQYLK